MYGKNINDQNKQGLTIKAVQININKSYTNTSALLNYSTKTNADILFVQEPNIKVGKVCGLTNSHQIIYETSNTKAVTVIINKNIHALYPKGTQYRIYNCNGIKRRNTSHLLHKYISTT